MLLFLLLLLVVIALAGGGWGYPRYGYVGLSPVGIVLLVIVVLWLTGHLRG